MPMTVVQSVFGQTAGAAASLAVALPNPTSDGDTLSLYLRFSPLTGTPQLGDSYGNKYRLVGATSLAPGLAAAFFAADLARGGAGHVVTAASQGGPQTMEMGVTQLGVVAREPGRDATATDFLAALLAQSYAQTALLRRLAAAERA